MPLSPSAPHPDDAVWENFTKIDSAPAPTAYEVVGEAVPSYATAMIMDRDQTNATERVTAADFPPERGVGPRADQAGVVDWFRAHSNWINKYVCHV